MRQAVATNTKITMYYKILVILSMLILSINGQSQEQLVGKNYGEPFKLTEFKKNFSKYSTTGIVSKSDSLCQFNEFGIYGSYNLIDNFKSDYYGELIVFYPGKAETWKFDSTNEKILELTTESNLIKLWNRKLIGISLKDLNDFIDKNFHYKKGQTYYADMGDYECILYFKNELTYKLKIKLKCKK